MTTPALQRLDRDDTSFDVAARRAARACTTEEARSELAAYLYLLPELSLDRIAGVFDVDVARARRLVERGSGPAPITSGDDCRGWALVAPQPGRNAAERVAATGHTSLCRGCRNRLRAHQLIERRVAKAGSATLGVGVVAAALRSIGGTSGAISGGASLPIAMLSGALAITTGAGALVATHRHATTPLRSVVPAATVQSPTAAPAGGGSSTAATITHPHHASTSRTGSVDNPVSNPSQSTAPLPLPTQLPSLPGRNTPLPLPGTQLPKLPVPVPTLPSVSTSPLPLPLPSVSLSPPALLP